MKAKRQGDTPKVSGQSFSLIIVVGILAVLSLVLGEIFHSPSRIIIPFVIILLWIGGAMTLWHFGKRRIYGKVKRKR